MFLAAIAPYLQVAGTVMAAGSMIQQGQNAKKAAAANSLALNKQAIQEGAVGIVKANEARHRATLLASRVSAVAAASGAGGFGVEQILSDIAAEGEKQAGYANYESTERAKGLRYRGDVGVADAEAQASQATISAGATLFSGMSKASGMYREFGGKI